MTTLTAQAERLTIDELMAELAAESSNTPLPVCAHDPIEDDGLMICRNCAEILGETITEFRVTNESSALWVMSKTGASRTEIDQANREVFAIGKQSTRIINRETRRIAYFEGRYGLDLANYAALQASHEAARQAALDAIPPVALPADLPADFVVTDRQSANVVLHTLTANAARIAALQSALDLRIAPLLAQIATHSAPVHAEIEEIKAKSAAIEAQHTEALNDLAKRELAGGKPRTLNLTWGSLSFHKLLGKLAVKSGQMAAAVKFCQELVKAKQLPESIIVNPEPQVAVADLKKTGMLLPADIFDQTLPSDKFTISPAQS